MTSLTLSAKELAQHIDHTLLKPEATPEQIARLWREAQELQVHAVCVASRFLPAAHRGLLDSRVLLAAVVGFPLGNQHTEAKIFETRLCVEHGADEIDMVLAVGLLKAGDHKAVTDEIAGVVLASQGRPVKVIIETHLLTRDEQQHAVDCIRRGGAQYVKTSTGFTGGGATIDDVRFLKTLTRGDLKIKASGGIRDVSTARALLAAGADRLGTSHTRAILQGELEASPGDAY